jgi:toxin ParE1/3/4
MRDSSGRFIVAPAAERDIRRILEQSLEQFGDTAMPRYRALIVQAILDVAEDPHRAGSLERPELLAIARTYHIANSRDRVPKFAGRVKSPRHFLLYRVISDGKVEIGRVLHESMELSRNLPADYRPEP